MSSMLFCVGAEARKYHLKLQVFWALICLLALGMVYLWSQASAGRHAMESARESIRKDILYRRWNAQHGGVYVPATGKTPPNPYLSTRPERDIVTNDGRRLTLVNPAYMTRQVHELAAEEYGSKGHITSLNPLRPQNAADDWETAALQRFQSGAAEIFETVEIDGEAYLRGMVPLRTEARCLGCHAAQGYQVGDLRGGLSVQIPMRVYLRNATGEFFGYALGVFCIWGVGAGVLHATGRRLQRHAAAEQQAQVAIAESEQRYRQLFEHMSSGFALHEVICDASGQPVDYRFLAVNALFTELTGLSAAQVLGKTVMEVLPRTEPIWIQRFGRVALTGTSERFYDFSAELGKYFGVSAFSPQPGQFAVFINDITARMTIERQVFENERRYNELSRLSRSVVWEVDATGLYTYVGGAALQVFGRGPEELVGCRYFYDLHPVVGRAAFMAESFASFDRCETFVDFLNPVELPDGQVCWVATTGEPILGENGQLLGYRGIDRDVTERKLTRDILQARLQLMEMAASKSIAAIHQSTLDEAEQLTGSCIGFYHHFNEASGQLQLEAWSTRTLAEFCRAEGNGRHYDLTQAGIWADCIRLRRPVTHENYATLVGKKGLPPGHAEVLRELVVPVFRAGAIVAVLGVGNKATPYTERDIEVVSQLADLSWDIAERKIAEQELVAARDAAESASRMKSEFLGNMSHELRTPLNGSIGMLELLKMTELTAEQNEYVAIANRSNQALLELLNDLLDLSRIEAGKLALRSAAFSLQETVQQLADFYALELSRKQQVGIFDCSAQCPALVLGDEGRIRQILLNLVGNAIKFTPEQGRISCRIACSAHDAVAHRAQVEIVVADTGIGIDPELRDEIFKPFVQGEQYLRKRYQGAGLGLSIVKRLVEMMEGNIQVESRVGCGTTVTIQLTLPVCRTEGGLTEVAAETLAAPVAPRKTMKILLVEDNEINLITVSRLLQRCGVETMTAENGLEALQALAREDYDLVLMDIQMPVLDGVTATKRIRAGGDGVRNPRIPLLAMTAYAMPDELAEFMAAGMDGVLTKPVNWQELSACLKKYSSAAT